MLAYALLDLTSQDSTGYLNSSSVRSTVDSVGQKSQLNKCKQNCVLSKNGKGRVLP